MKNSGNGNAKLANSNFDKIEVHVFKNAYFHQFQSTILENTTYQACLIYVPSHKVISSKRNNK